MKTEKYRVLVRATGVLADTGYPGEIILEFPGLMSLTEEAARNQALGWAPERLTPQFKDGRFTIEQTTVERVYPSL